MQIVLDLAFIVLLGLLLVARFKTAVWLVQTLGEVAIATVNWPFDLLLLCLSYVFRRSMRRMPGPGMFKRIKAEFARRVARVGVRMAERVYDHSERLNHQARRVLR